MNCLLDRSSGRPARWGALVVELEEPGLQGVDQRVVEAVQQHHRAVALVVVVVPVPARGQEQIARPHVHALAVDGGVGALALDDEPEGVRRVRRA